MTAATALLHEHWPDLYLKAQVCGTRSSTLHVLARPSKSLLNIADTDAIHRVQPVVALPQGEHDFLFVSLGRRRPPWGCRAGTQVCSALCLIIPRGFKASYVAIPYALSFITLKVEIIYTSEEHCMDKSINHEITDGRCKRNAKD